MKCLFILLLAILGVSAICPVEIYRLKTQIQTATDKASSLYLEKCITEKTYMELKNELQDVLRVLRNKT